MKKIINLIFAFSLFAITLQAQDNVIDEVVWVVGDEVILKSQVEEQYRNMQYERQKIEGDPYCFIPEQMAVQKLFLHQANIDSIYADESQVAQEVGMTLNIGQLLSLPLILLGLYLIYKSRTARTK